MQENVHNVRPGNVLELAVTRNGGEKRGGEDCSLPYQIREELTIPIVVEPSHLLNPPI